MDPLVRVGFDEHFAVQCAAYPQLRPARILEVKRETILVTDGIEEHILSLAGHWFQLAAQERPAVGDWILLDKLDRVVRLLDRKSVLVRHASGPRDELQVLAANVDVLFIVTACNAEFNPSRLERYLTLALDANVQPVIVLTKADACTDPAAFVAQARALRRDLPVLAVDARDAAAVNALAPWSQPGRTVALVGSSGVGKSTLVNTMAGKSLQRTAAARAHDERGRHTTTHRSLHVLSNGALLIDAPGIRELRVAVAAAAVHAAFDDVQALAAQCRFGDCTHTTEPDCAVRRALEAGALDQRRLANFRKLMAEQSAVRRPRGSGGRRRRPRAGDRADDTRD